MTITLPEDVRWITGQLEAAGFQAFAVGGCVRDSLLGRAPKDWDICTDALPEETRRVFDGCRTIETGLKHGTLTVMRGHTPYEVTTFRVDGAYTDHRHPDSVAFVTDVRADLARRDFTVNAMAYSPRSGLVDAFGGQADLAAGLIRCVGRPADRFEEDALRILRALRFASVYGFRVEAETDAAIRALHPTLERVAAERIHAEMAKLLCGEGAARVLEAFPEVVRPLLPGVPEGDAWAEALRTLAETPPEEALRLAALLSPLPGADRLKAAEAIPERLRMDTATARALQTLAAEADTPLSADRPALLFLLNRLGEERLRQLMTLRRATAIGKGRLPAEADAAHRALLAALDALLAEAPCFTLKQLSVSGQDALRAGLRGPQVGQALEGLLRQVMTGALPNEREALLKALEQGNHSGSPTGKGY